ncbi:hypothetical protein J3327_10445, partial [Leuconostoc mesenteroides]|nr:hypothetical protein [Leuconostoc mesenteroides]
DDLNDKKAEVFRAMAPLDPDRCVRGQYLGYTEVAGVASDSATETYVALRTEIDNWRWAGVPIFVRAGKELPAKVTEVRLFLRRVPALAFLPNRRPAEPTRHFRISYAVFCLKNNKSFYTITYQRHCFNSFNITIISPTSLPLPFHSTSIDSIRCSRRVQLHLTLSQSSHSRVLCYFLVLHISSRI